MAGVVIFALIVFGGGRGALLHTTDPEFIDTGARNVPPSLGHPMGTDNIGRDIFPRCSGRAR